RFRLSSEMASGCWQFAQTRSYEYTATLPAGITAPQLGHVLTAIFHLRTFNDYRSPSPRSAKIPRGAGKDQSAPPALARDPPAERSVSLLRRDANRDTARKQSNGGGPGTRISAP